MLFWGYLLYLAGFKKSMSLALFKGRYWHLKFDIAVFLYRIYLSCYTFFPATECLPHTHMLASHSRQLSGSWIIRVHKLDIYVIGTVS